MHPFKRKPAPDFLFANWVEWSEEYANRKIANASAKFSWYKSGYQEINKLLLPDLQEQTQYHCSYCDRDLLFLGDDTIDHFKPKGDSRFYRLAFQWENLFFCCWHCQKAKGEKYHEFLLRPDEPGFSFPKYFDYLALAGELRPNPMATEEEKKRAAITIEYFGMNEKGMPEARKREWQRFLNSKSPVLNDFGFRFLFE